MDNMRLLTFCCLLGCTIAGCRISTTEGGGGLPPPSSACRFAADTIGNMRNIPISDENLDSSRSYTYFTNAVRMDSLLPALCAAGLRVDSAFFVTQYLCMDARGPRPVVVLRSRDPSMLNRGCSAGATGRLSCAAQ